MLLLAGAEGSSAAPLSRYLDESGVRVVVATDGVDAIHAWRRERPDVVVLDLPMARCLEVCARLRAESNVPILILSDGIKEEDLIACLDSGADDYMVKPLSGRELVARLRALARRARVKPRTDERTHLRVADLELDRRGRTAMRNGEAIVLKPKEFELLFQLAGEPGRVFTRAQLLERIWGYEFFGGSRTIDVHIHWLREKLGASPDGKPRIITIRGVGYKFES